jgi:signal transduction histidine kinase
MLRGLTGRIVAAGGILLLLIGGGFAGLFLAIGELRSADVQVTRSETDLRAADRIERLLVDLETGLRGFVITRDEQFLEPWNAGRDAFSGEVNALIDKTEDLTQATRLRAIAAAGAAYVEDYGVPLIDAVRSGDPTAGSVTTTLLGKQRVDGLRASLAEFIDAERQTFIARQDAADNLAGTATRAASVAVAASVGLIALFIVYLARTMVRPVTGAARMAGRLADGDLSTRMTETGTAEIGILERSFNSLAASLEESNAAQRGLLSELAASRARIVTASDDARRRIERNLHDGAQQRLVSLGLRLRTLEASLAPGQDEVGAEIRQVTGEVAGVIDELREISRGLYPASLSRGGLASAVRTLARRSPLPIELDIRTEARLTEPVQAAGYYVVAEAVTNAAKHASATEVGVTLEDQDGMLRVAVRDDGLGGADPSRGSGLTGLRDRVEALGGRLEITSAPGEGTVLVAEIPTG